MFFDIKTPTDVKHSIVRLCTFTLVLLSTRALAVECSILRLQAHRSLGAAITHNKCPAATDLSLESIIELQAGTRIWLESVALLQQDIGYHIVCLNKSSVVQKLKIVRANAPWLTSLSLPDCSSWLANRLACKQPGNHNEILLCAISQKPSSTAMRAVQSKTSVTVRGFSNPLQIKSPHEQPNWTRFVNPDVNLCRRLLNTNQAITLNWTIETTGMVSHASIVEAGIDQQFSACVLEALEHTHFPDVAHETHLTATF